MPSLWVGYGGYWSRWLRQVVTHVPCLWTATAALKLAAKKTICDVRNPSYSRAGTRSARHGRGCTNTALTHACCCCVGTAAITNTLNCKLHWFAQCHHTSDTFAIGASAAVLYVRTYIPLQVLQQPVLLPSITVCYQRVWSLSCLHNPAHARQAT